MIKTHIDTKGSYFFLNLPDQSTDKYSMKARWIFYFLAPLLLIGCMPNIEDDEGIDKPDIINHSVSAAAAGSTYHVTMTGKCPAETDRLYIAVDGDAEYNEVKSSDSGVGSFFGSCSSGNMNITYNVPDPYTKRDITFKVRSRNKEGRMGAIETYTLHYSMVAAPLPGFAVLSFGGLTDSNTANYVLTSGGQAFSPIQIGDTHKGLDIAGSPSDAMVRYGLIGILLVP